MHDIISGVMFDLCGRDTLHHTLVQAGWMLNEEGSS